MFPPHSVMYQHHPFDGVGYAHIWILKQVQDDGGEGELSITMVIQAEHTAYYRAYKAAAVILNLFQDPYMDEVHIIIPATAVDGIYGLKESIYFHSEGL